MRILYYELHKLWRLPILLAITILGLLIFCLFMAFHISFFPNGHPAAELYAIAREWTEKYGTTMEPDEYADAQRSYTALIAEADALVAADPLCAARGITDWAGFIQLINDYHNSMTDANYTDFLALHDPFFSETYDFIGYRVQALHSALLAYEFRAEAPYHDNSSQQRNPAENARFAELSADPRAAGIFPSECIGNLSNYMCWASIFGVLSVTMLLAPAGAREHLSRMPAQQWATRQGRRLVWQQLAAALVSAVLLFLLESIIFSSIYSQLETQFFWNSPIYTFLHGKVFWFDLTYGQYILCFLTFDLMLMLGTAGIIFAFTRVCENYISALMKALPLFVVLMFTAAAVVSYPLTSANELYQHTRVRGIEALLCGLVLSVGLALSVYFSTKSQRKELF